MTGATLNTDGSGGGDIFIRGGAFVAQSGSLVTAQTTGVDDGGVVEFRTETLELIDSQVSSNTNFFAGPVRGAGGTVRFVDIGTVNLDSGIVSSDSVFGGNAGEVRFENVGTVELRGDSRISAESDRGALGGNVAFDAIGSLALFDTSAISTSTTALTNFPAGTISINAIDAINIFVGRCAVGDLQAGGLLVLADVQAPVAGHPGDVAEYFIDVVDVAGADRLMNDVEAALGQHRKVGHTSLDQP